MGAYYNENDKFCAEWLRNLIREGLIADGEVDTRSIRDVRPIDLVGFDQCHFFSGIGLWSLALRWAGWPDDRPAWTGSCPCQPFSQAGARAGFDDERHLWPDWFWLIDQRRPDVIFGEQVESEDGRAWLDLVCTDLEARAYACGPAVLPSAGLGAPNERHRFYWVADAAGSRCHQQQGTAGEPSGERGVCWGQPADSSGAGGLELASGIGQQAGGHDHGEHDGAVPGAAVAAGRLGDAEGIRPSSRTREPHAGHGQDQPQRPSDDSRSGLGDPGDARLPDAEPRGAEGSMRRNEGRATQQPSRPRDPWRELEWIDCLDGRRRPVEPQFLEVAPGHTGGVARRSTFPLAPRQKGDVAQLRAIGNAINPYVAEAMIRAFMERDA